MNAVHSTTKLGRLWPGLAVVLRRGWGDCNLAVDQVVAGGAGAGLAAAALARASARRSRSAFFFASS